ncbi:serine/threonine dehydratase [Planctomycetota bacterium]|nr:threonine/serine dehydratase [Planctomycetota bacterium]GDY03697.1 serine/threonine dehydratase [Planctomycetota bacterium]
MAPLPYVCFDDVRAAAERIRGRVHRTPVVTSATLDRELGASVHFKCENLQKCGAFKARGAVNAVFALDDAAAVRGVVTHSSGNHAAALAYAASVRGIPCAVVMPDTAPRVKVDAVRGYGAEIVFCKPAERESACAALQAERGATLVHPFENAHVIAGQGTAALELIMDVADLDFVIAPVGGGGLIAGTLLAAHALASSARVLGAEPLAVDDAARSLATGVRQPRVENPQTFADGLLTGIGEVNFAIAQCYGLRVITVHEDAMLAAARFFLERMKLVVEPSSATVLAALRQIAPELRGKRIGAILSGGNTDFRWLQG